MPQQKLLKYATIVHHDITAHSIRMNSNDLGQYLFNVSDGRFIDENETKSTHENRWQYL